MKDTPESLEGQETVKTAQPKPRPARPKPDSATPTSQDQDAKPAVRRRTPPTHTPNGNSNTEAPAPTQPGPENVPAPRSSDNAPIQRGPENGPAPRGPENTRPAFNQRGPENTQGSRGPAFNPRGPGRPGPAGPNGPRYGGGPIQQTQRTGGTMTSNPRSGGSAVSPQRPGGNGTMPPSRQGNNNQSYAPRPSNTTGAPPQHTTYGGPGQRPGQTRQGGSAPGGPRQPQHGHGQQGGHGRPGGGRPGTAQRPQERRAAAVKEKVTGPVQIPPQIVVKDLADLLHTTANEVIRGLIKLSIFANINEVVEYEKAALVAQELGFEPSLSVITTTPASQGEHKLSANEAMIASRNDDGTIVIPPVVTIMGHVDHGKTSLLDTIRKTKVAAGEAGGITQHIGAYQVETNGKKITFLDTPGHEAFTAMRARGAQVTHIAIIVVAADDGVMPQTREAIDHAQAAKVPIIIALNKIDKANANPDRVKQQLADIGIVIEEYGGETVCVPVSARRGIGIDELLEYILLVAEVQDIRANPNRLATGVIIEARLEKNTGPMATVLVQQGTLKMGDNIIVGAISGKVRAMFNDRGKRIQKAPPSTPVSVLGLPEVPQAGDHLEVVADERTAKSRAQQEAEKRRDEMMPLGQVSLDTLYMQMQEGKVKELNLVLKCDVQGSAEAIKNALTKLGEENIKVRLIHEGIGNISETDVHLAAASGAVIIGFNVKADGAAQRQAQKEGVDIRYYNVIYKLTDDIQAALVGMLEPTYREVVEGHAEVMQIFKAGKTVVIAGCRVTDGKLTRSSQVRIMRKAEKVYEGKIGSLRRGKDDVREVATGYECGVTLEDFSTFEMGDILEAFAQERVKHEG